MRVTLFTNYLNAHMLPLSLALNDAHNVDFTFVALNGEAESVGRPNLNDAYDFVVRPYESDNAAACARKHALEDDVVIFGHMGGDETLVRDRMRLRKLTFRYAERILKRGLSWRFAPPKIWRTYDWFGRYRNRPYYVLCTGAYAAQDLVLSGFPIEHCLDWGYFSESADLNTRDLRRATQSSASAPLLLWAGRMINWKHPEAALELAERLRNDGRRFRLAMVGDGPLAESLRNRVCAAGLEALVDFTGEVCPKRTLDLMRESDLFLFTSDRKEGWGVVLSEAMTQGCAVVANADAGSSATLIRHGENGLLYDGTAGGLHRATSRMLDEPDCATQLGARAFDTMRDIWSADHAAGNFLLTARALLEGRNNPVKSGPCAPARFLREDWFKAEWMPRVQGESIGYR